MSGIVIGQKSLLEKVKPHLGDFFANGEYTFYDANALYYSRKERERERERERESLRQKCESGSVDVILFVTKNEQTRELAHLLKGVTTPAYYIPHYVYDELDRIESLRDVAVEVDLRKPRLNYLEFHVADHCNLNCKGCTHFSNIEPEPHFTDFDSWVKDLERLHELFWGIARIRLMGGEALLNPELWKFVEATRRIFPDADVRVVTNGLLIPKIPDILVSTMKKAHAGFDISNYIPTEKRKDVMLAKLNECGVEYNYSDQNIETFWKRLTINPVSSKEEAYLPCSCNFLREGTLSICPFVALIDKFNAAYGFEYPTDERYNIYETDDGWRLYEALNSPAEFCRYCEPYAEQFSWIPHPGAKAKPEDWLVDEADIPRLKREQKVSNIKSSIHHPKATAGRICNKFPVIGMPIQYVYHKYILRE